MKKKGCLKLWETDYFKIWRGQNVYIWIDKDQRGHHEIKMLLSLMADQLVYRRILFSTLEYPCNHRKSGILIDWHRRCLSAHRKPAEKTWVFRQLIPVKNWYQVLYFNIEQKRFLKFIPSFAHFHLQSGNLILLLHVLFLLQSFYP